jgi:hypothetical protein
MRKLTFILATCVLMLAGTVRADHYADVYVIPVASHTPGFNNTNWQSDIAIYNFQSTPLRVEMILIESGASTTDNVVPLGTAATVIPANGSRIVADVLANQPRPTSNVGAIIIGGDKAFAVTSRSYSMAPSGDTVGQTVVPSRDFITEALNDTPSPSVAYIPGLISNGRFRSNLGFVAGAGAAEPLVFEVTVSRADGVEIGTQRYTVPAGNYMHRQFSSTTIGTTQFDAGSARYRVVSGDGQIVPYASVIDNATADAVFVSGNFPANAKITALRQGASSPFRSLLERFPNRASE